MKCIAEGCKKKIKEGHWCSLDCKKQFYKDNYLGSSLVHTMEKEFAESHANQKDNALKAWKKSGIKKFSDYLMSLGNFQKC